ncbi:MAG: ribosome maturation factor RimP [Peptoniphilaceae bacterium]
MKKSDIINKVNEIAQISADKLGYEIVDVEFKNGSKHDLISIYIYKKEGIDLDDCSIMSREIEKELDNIDLIKNPYYLEVSSPGLDRPIKSEADYNRNIGNEVEVKLYAPLNGKKSIEGLLKGYTDSDIILGTNEGDIEIPIKTISLMKQLIKF